VAINDYITVDQFRAVMPNDPAFSDARYDTLLTHLITRACRALDRYTNRKPGAYQVDTDVTLYFDGSDNGELWIGELAAAPTSVKVAEGGIADNSAGTGGTYSTWSASDYLLWPYNALDDGRPYLRMDINSFGGTKAAWYRFPKSVKIVGKFGYSTEAPDDIQQAAITQTVRWFQRGKQGFRDTGAVEALAQLQYVKAIDPEVALMVQHLRRQAI
jgi:hypothetical protein